MVTQDTEFHSYPLLFPPDLSSSLYSQSHVFPQRAPVVACSGNKGSPLHAQVILGSGAEKAKKLLITQWGVAGATASLKWG